MWGWSVYDWANSAFATTVLAGFFPVFFKNTYSRGQPAVVVTSRLAVATSLAIAVVVLLAPILGAMADRGAWRKRALAGAMLLGTTSTALLAFIAPGQWLVACIVFAAANVGFSLANVFYDGLLVAVATERERDRVSALGYALGYLGGGLLFLVNVAMVLKPAAFHIASAEMAVRLSFLSVAAWWVVFSVPLLRWVREPDAAGLARPVTTNPSAWAGLWKTARSLPQQRQLFLFLIAFWLYIDGVGTVIRMALDYGASIGLATSHLISALLLTQFIGFPAAILFGRFGERWGAKKSVLLGIVVYAAVTVLATRMHTALEFYLLAATVGLVQGGVQSLSRSIYSRLIPADRASEYFGFYGVLDKSAAFLGPLLMGWVGLATNNSRLGILSLLVLFVAGGWLLMKVKLPAMASEHDTGGITAHSVAFEEKSGAVDQTAKI
jgi:UMF1 family MFS transporter